jgi:2-methylisocitrate lyase-like PEP mutase family enzyme
LNIEDSDHRSPGVLVDADHQAERIAGIKEASAAVGAELVVNARVDTFVARRGRPEDQLEEGLRRARLYLSAGADCIYPILLGDQAMLAAFVRAVGVINVNVRRGGQLSLAQLSTIGVRRVTYATSLFRDATTFVQIIANEIKGETDALAEVGPFR